MAGGQDRAKVGRRRRGGAGVNDALPSGGGGGCRAPGASESRASSGPEAGPAAMGRWLSIMHQSAEATRPEGSHSFTSAGS